MAPCYSGPRGPREHDVGQGGMAGLEDGLEAEERADERAEQGGPRRAPAWGSG